MVLFCVVQGENVVKEIFPKKVAELNALLEVICILHIKISHICGGWDLSKQPPSPAAKH